MRITAIGLLKHNGQDKQPTILGLVSDLSNFGFFQRNAVKETILFMARTIVQRMVFGSRKKVAHEEYMAYVHVTDSGLSAIVLADMEYPHLAAFSICKQMLDDCIREYGDSWRNVVQDVAQPPKFLADAIVKYQDPAKADKILKIQKDLDDTKAVLQETIEGILQRGEKLDDLVAKSNDLSIASKAFYKTAKKTNSCCRMM